MHTYMAMVKVLCERWHSDPVTFHLPTGEMIVTLEDVYHIFRLPVGGMPVMVMRDTTTDAVVQRLMGSGVDYQI